MSQLSLMVRQFIVGHEGISLARLTSLCGRPMHEVQVCIKSLVRAGLIHARGDGYFEGPAMPDSQETTVSEKPILPTVKRPGQKYVCKTCGGEKGHQAFNAGDDVCRSCRNAGVSQQKAGGGRPLPAKDPAEEDDCRVQITYGDFDIQCRTVDDAVQLLRALTSEPA